MERKFDELVFYKENDCLEEKERKFYCSNIDNLYCPKICSFARRRKENEIERKSQEIKARLLNLG
jgi:hypothetical protein